MSLQSTEILKKTPLILSFFAVALFIVAYFPALQILVEKWANSDDYTHAFFTIPIIIYMIWLRRDSLQDYSGKGFPGLLLVIGSLMLYLISLQLQVPTIIAIATVLTIISAFIYLSGLQIIINLAIPFTLLAMLIPIPNQVYSLITFPLQLKVTQISHLLFQLLQLPVFREGNMIFLPDKSFQVVEACSGLRSLITLSTLSLIMGYFFLQKKRCKLILVLLSLPVAFFVNIIRVSAMVLAQHYFGLDLTEGTAHTAMGLVIFCLALIILFTLQRIMELWETKEKQN